MPRPPRCEIASRWACDWWLQGLPCPLRCPSNSEVVRRVVAAGVALPPSLPIRLRGRAASGGCGGCSAPLVAVNGQSGKWVGGWWLRGLPCPLRRLLDGVVEPCGKWRLQGLPCPPRCCQRSVWWVGLRMAVAGAALPPSSPARWGG